MRRFKHSLFARVASRVVILSLVANFLTFGMLFGNAEAQFRTAAKQWAVIDFVNNSGVGGQALAGTATDAVSNLLLGTNRFDILPREAVERIYRELELNPPITRDLDILKIGQALNAETIVTGEITQARVNRSANGKSADVVLYVRGIDVASGLPVLGAAVHGQSSERPGDVSDETVLNEAVSYAAQKAVDEMLMQQVDVATVLTTPTVSTVQLNKGSRQGIKNGMEMVVTRGREQVAKVRISDVSPDVSTATVISSSKGVAPGDKARAVYSKLPTVTLGSKPGAAKVRTARRGDASAALLSLLVVGALALTIQSGGGENGPGNLVTEATTLADGSTPAVRLTWHPNIFNGGRGRVEWHLWRQDYIPTPVRVVNGTESRAFDFPGARIEAWRDMGTTIGGTECIEDPGQENFDDPAPGIDPGTTYMYLISLVYKLSSLDLPGGGAGGGGGATECFFQTGRQAAIGPVTPLTPVVLTTPVNGATDIGALVQFSWQSTPGANEYAVELSTRPDFRNRNQMVVVARVNTLLQGGVATDPINISALFPGVQRLYWRVGARNAVDVPGPVPDALGERYVFGSQLGINVFQFDRIIPPPPPPGGGKKGG